MQDWSPPGGSGTEIREVVGVLGGKATPAGARACQGVRLAALHGKTRTSHCPPLPFLYPVALGYSPQLPIARLPLEPGKSPLPFSHPLGLGICSANFFFPEILAVFHIDCCLFPHSGCCFLLLATLLSPL